MRNCKKFTSFKDVVLKLRHIRNFLTTIDHKTQYRIKKRIKYCKFANGTSYANFLQIHRVAQFFFVFVYGTVSHLD